MPLRLLSKPITATRSAIGVVPSRPPSTSLTSSFLSRATGVVAAPVVWPTFSVFDSPQATRSDNGTSTPPSRINFLSTTENAIRRPLDRPDPKLPLPESKPRNRRSLQRDYHLLPKLRADGKRGWCQSDFRLPLFPKHVAEA